MTATVPTVEPTSVIAGDTVAWTKAIDDYPANDGWALSYSLLSSGKTPISVTSTADGTTHSVSVAAAATALWVAATYTWTSFVTKGTARYSVASGLIEIKPNPATQTSAYDPRTHEEKCLAAIEAVLEGRMSDDIVHYRIGTAGAGREAWKLTHKELLELHSIYRARVARQKGGSLMTIRPVRFR